MKKLELKLKGFEDNNSEEEIQKTKDEINQLNQLLEEEKEHKMKLENNLNYFNEQSEKLQEEIKDYKEKIS